MLLSFVSGYVAAICRAVELVAVGWLLVSLLRVRVRDFLLVVDARFVWV